jgi:hypothetical protein
MSLKRRTRGSGFGLVEAIIVAAAVAMAVAGVYKFYASVQAREQAHQESQNALKVTNNILRAYTAMPNFSDVSNARLVNENLIPGNMDISGPTSSPTIGSIFGGEMIVSPVDLDLGAGTVEGSGLVLTYTNVPRRLCSQFVTNTAAGFNFRDVKVGNTSVLDTNRVLDTSSVIEQCAAASESSVSFTLQRTQVSMALGSAACVVPSSSPETQTTACPAGYTGEQVQVRTATCPPGASVPVWGGWSTTSNTCTQVCTPESSSPETRTTTACPSGLYGSITERRVSTCAVGQTTGSPTWSAWTEVSNTCAAQCVVPADETRSPGCPSGQSGVFTERRSATCPQAAGNPVWGPWTTLTNTCSQTCVLPTPNPEVRWVQNSGNCDTGFSGTKFWEVEQTRTASCPASTGSPTYTAWASTGATRNEDVSQCASLCRPDTQLERWVPKEESCGVGTSGSHTWEARETRTSYCPSNATNPTTSEWQATGEIRNEDNSCVAASCRLSGGTPFSWKQAGNTYECTGQVTSDMIIESGHMVTIQGSAQIQASGYNFRASGQVQFMCSAGALSQQPIAPTCAPAACNVSSTTQATWTAAPNDQSCSATYSTGMGGTSGMFSVPVGNTFTVRDTTTPILGSLTLQCVQSSASGLGLVANIEETTDRSCFGSCTTVPRPAADQRSFAGCPSGGYGTWQQTDSYESSDFPVCWANTTQVWLPATAPSGACTTCPSPTTELQWGTTTDGTCLVNQYGTTDREKEQSRTKSYTCPAGSATLPAPNYTAWVNTGNTRVTANNCASCPSPFLERQWVVANATASCAAGQYGLIGQEAEQSRTKSYSCPAGTTTLPAPNYTTWTNTGNTRATNNACTSCPAAVTEERQQWVTTTTRACANGQYGNIARQKEQESTRSKYYSCPAGTATLPAASYTAWTAYADTGVVRDTTGGNTCATCPAAVVEKRWVATANGTCAAGTWGYTSREKEQSRTKSYDCSPAPNTLPSPSYTTWTDTGNTRQSASSCTACPAATTETDSQWVATTPRACTSNGQYGDIDRERMQTRTRTTTYSCPAGTTTLPTPVVSAWSAWANTSTYRDKAGGNSCATCPAATTETDSQWVATTPRVCANGYYGDIDRERMQTRTRSKSYDCSPPPSTLPSPTYGAWSAWANTSTYRDKAGGNSCAACPAATTEYRWDPTYRTAACPSGQSGTHKWQAQQKRTKSYDCSPAPSTLPSASYTSWVDTGAKTNETNTCAPIASPCVLSVDTKFTWNVGSAYCSGINPGGNNTIPAGTYASGTSKFLTFYRLNKISEVDGSATFTCNNGTFVASNQYCWTGPGTGGGGAYCDDPSTPYIEACP